jgi:hypothetical protein
VGQHMCRPALKLSLMEVMEHNCKYHGCDDAENYDINVWVTFH